MDMQIRRLNADSGHGEPPPIKPPSERSVPVEPVDTEDDTVEGGA